MTINDFHVKGYHNKCVEILRRIDIDTLCREDVKLLELQENKEEKTCKLIFEKECLNEEGKQEIRSASYDLDIEKEFALITNEIKSVITTLRKG